MGLKTWPNWPEFTQSNVPADKENEYKGYKQQILDKYGEDKLRQAWIKTCRALESVTEELQQKGSSAIPELTLEELEHLSKEKEAELKKIGCFVVRQVIPEQEATAQYNSAKKYVSDNGDKVYGWPPSNPSVYRLFWTPTQQALRSHPNQLRVQRILNGWWTDKTNVTSPDPLTYADAIRIRPAGQEFYGLGPHIDAGSLCRWADPAHHTVYDAIFSGEPEKHNAYDLGVRKEANSSLFPGPAHATVFRSFQGWTALTETRPREGSLLLYPYVSSVIAYVVLRPLFEPPAAQEDIMDPEKWTLNVNNGWYPGTVAEQSQYLSRASHPHLKFEQCLVHIPEMKAGDTIWWHCDMCHAVEVEHIGSHDASVVYIAATPTTPHNVRYIKQQLKDFLAGGPPEDFPGGMDERVLKGYLGEKGINGGEAGKAAMGYGL